MRYINPIIKWEVHSPLARLLPWAELSFEGRRTGRRIEVIVRMYALDALGGEPVTFTPNPWRANFDEPRRVQWRFKGKVEERTLTLVRDPAEVARVLNQLLDQGLWVPAGLRVPKGERFTAEGVAATNTAMLQFS
jgi:hypothetical protein